MVRVVIWFQHLWLHGHNPILTSERANSASLSRQSRMAKLDIGQPSPLFIAKTFKSFHLFHIAQSAVRLECFGVIVHKY